MVLILSKITVTKPAFKVGPLSAIKWRFACGPMMDPYHFGKIYRIHKRSYVRAHVLFNILNVSMKRDKMRGLTSILSLFRNALNKFNNTGANVRFFIT